MAAEDDDRIWQPSEILSRYEAGERDFRGIEIEATRGTSDPEFRRAYLTGADFTGAFIVADFSGATLRGARFAPANVKTCTFDGADLRDADFAGAAIDSATFDGADLAGTNFEGAGDYGYTYRKDEYPGPGGRPTRR
jgi:uncharacterized protein YjbI with pentapeptide repeats